VLNNLHMQYDIQDRRRVYAILEKEGIEIPRYAVLDRDSPDPKRKYTQMVFEVHSFRIRFQNMNHHNY